MNKISKALMIPMQPQNTINTLNGKRILDLRLWIPKNYVGWVYVYVTKSKPYLIRNKNYGWQHKKQYSYFLVKEPTHYSNEDNLNGKVVFRFWFDDYIAYKYYEDNDTYFAKRPQDFGYNADEVLKRLCLSRDEFKAYGKGKDLYVWHIKKLEIFDEPKELSDFKTEDISQWQDETGTPAFDDYFELTKAPKRSVWIYV